MPAAVQAVTHAQLAAAAVPAAVVAVAAAVLAAAAAPAVVAAVAAAAELDDAVQLQQKLRAP